MLCATARHAPHGASACSAADQTSDSPKEASATGALAKETQANETLAEELLGAAEAKAVAKAIVGMALKMRADEDEASHANNKGITVAMS